MTPEKRNQVSEFLATRWLENTSTRALERFFYETQLEYLSSYTDAELVSELEDNTTEEEFAALQFGCSYK
jgi:hypothetical protein